MNHTSYTASNLKIHFWALGALGSYWMSGVMYSLVSLIFITSYEMNPAWVGMCMMLPRLIDMFVDPVLGRLSDNLKTPWGRRRPFIFATTIIGAICVSGIWWIPVDWVQDWRGFAYLLAFSTILYANLGAFDMSHNALGYELSDDYNQRSKVQAARNLYFMLGSLGGGWFYWLAQRPVFGEGHLGEIHGVRMLAFGVSAIVLIAGLISVFASSERFNKINSHHVAIWPALKATISNKAFFYLLIIKSINAIGATLAISMSSYILIYSVCNGDKELFNKVVSGWIGIAGFILAFVLVGVAAPITRLLGKRKGLILCYGILAVQAMLTPFVAIPGNVYGYFVFTLLFVPVLMVLNNLLASIMPDICDVDELEYGERREGLFTAVMSFVTKLENSICTGIGASLLAYSGFNGKLTQQPQEVLDTIRIFGFTPLIGGAILTFIAVCFFPLTKKIMDEVRAKLDARHAAAHIAGVEADAQGAKAVG